MQNFLVDPWKSSDVDLPSLHTSPQQRETSSHLQKLSSNTSTAFNQEEYNVLLQRLWHTAATADSVQLLDIMDSFRDEFLPFLSSFHSSSNVTSTASDDYYWKEFLDSKNSDGSSALHVAACFGQREICWTLITHGATVDIKDKHGWTPLIWATNNARDEVVKLLLEQGASSLNDTNPPHSDSTLNPNKSKISIGDGFYRAAFDFNGLDRELEQTMGSGLGSGANAPVIDNDDYDNDSSTADHLAHLLFPDSSPSINETTNFNWDECLPDQMYVFDLRQIERLSDALVANLTMPHITRSSISTKFVSANTLFLAVRYAHYYGSKDLMNILFEDCVGKLEKLLLTRKHDMCFLAYWLANSSQLLYFLKRDPGLCVSSFEWQGRWSELVQDIFNLIVEDAESRLRNIWRPSLMDFESIPGGDAVQWDSRRKTRSNSGPRKPYKSKDSLTEKKESGWFSGTIFKRKKSDPVPVNLGSNTQFYGSLEMETPSALQADATSLASNASPKSSSNFSFSLFSKPRPPVTLSPRSICTLLSSILFVMQSYQCHPSFQLQLLKQVFYGLGAMLVNCFVLNSGDSKFKYCSRWKAMQIRMNLSVIENWIRYYTLPRAQAKRILEERFESKIQSDKPALEDLLYPILVDPSDDLLPYLKNSIIVCQILQVATTSFGQVEKLENPLNSFFDTLVSISDSISTNSSFKKDSNPIFSSPALNKFRLEDFADLNAKQLHKIFFDYHYEKDEPLIAQEVVGYLEAHCIENEESFSLKQPETNPKDLINFQETSQGSLKKRMSLTIDPDYLLPFRLHFILPSSTSIALPDDAVSNDSAEWGDKNERMEKKKKDQERERLRNDEEIWWERRVKIEIPEWLLKRVE